MIWRCQLTSGIGHSLALVCALWTTCGSAAIVTYTIDSGMSSLALSALVTRAQYATAAQVVGSDTTQLSGTLVADLNGSNLTFSGTSNVVALANPNGPFAPPSQIVPSVENAGLTNDPNDFFGLNVFDAAFRNASATFSSGTATFGGPVSNLKFEFTSGRVDYEILPPLQPMQNTLDLKSLFPDFNQSDKNMDRNVAGGVETVSIPISYSTTFQTFLPNDSTLFVDGLIVASRSVLPSVVAGDFNRDGHFTSADIQAMLSALADLHQFQADKQLSNDDLLTIGDLNGDRAITNADLELMLNRLKTGNVGTVSVPEPAPIRLLEIAAGAGLIFFARRRSH
jgi:hypothetical protein